MRSDPRRSLGCWLAAASMLLVVAMPFENAFAGPSARALFGSKVLREVVISPSGELLASIEKRKGWDTVRLRRRGAARGVEAFKRLSGIRAVAWIDDEHLLVGLGRQQSYRVVTVDARDGRLRTNDQPVRASGRMVDLLQNLGEDVLWAVEAKGRTSVYRVSIETLLREKGAIDEEGGHQRVASLGPGIDRWVTDRDGTVRAALRVNRATRESELWYRPSADSDWGPVVEADDPDEIVHPLGMAENGVDLVVSSKIGRDTWALYEFSPDSGELGRELFSTPDADVTDVLYDYTRSVVVAAVYERAGLEQFHHFDPFLARYQRSLARALPGQVARMSGASSDRRFFVIFTRSPRDPGTYYVLDTSENTAVRIGRLMPWIEPEELVDVEALRLESTGGVEVEAFFARPQPARGLPPLVVMPHGGPAYVRDTRAFDPLVQYLAGNGFAVLQVNYRGSGGRGQAFLEAGKRQWGSGIEADVEAALEEVIGRGWVDADRVCITGGSYGGYSALISVVRSPGRYRCAASLNGPSDLPFSWASKFKHWPAGREYFEDFIGDPEDLEGLRSISPAYRAAEIRVPVLLAHGTEDRVVDVDHFHRMKAVLEALGKPHQTLLLEGGRHAPSGSEWVEYAGQLRRFLTRHLEPGREAPTEPR